MTRPTKNEHPKKGERILLCPHVGDEKRMFTFFRFKDAPISFQRPNDKLGLSSGMFICSECQTAFEGDLHRAVKTHVLWKNVESGILEALIQ